MGYFLDKTELLKCMLLKSLYAPLWYSFFKNLFKYWPDNSLLRSANMYRRQQYQYHQVARRRCQPPRLFANPLRVTSLMSILLQAVSHEKCTTNLIISERNLTWTGNSLFLLVNTSSITLCYHTLSISIENKVIIWYKVIRM